MNNLIAFVNQFMEYLLVFMVSIIAILSGCFIGIKWRKMKDAKQLTLATEETESKEK